MESSFFTEKLLLKRCEKIDKWLENVFESREIPERLKNAMKYSLMAGGKRLRPVLCLSCASLCGLEEDKILPFAGAIEMIHTYSLVHDDLPAMDNDDLRRGKPSCHVAFDEATAILAGDGLLTDAFFIACFSKCNPVNLLSALKELAYAVGSSGMVGGQQLDMLYAGESGLTLSQVKTMQFMKTGMFLSSACKCGAILAGANEEKISAIANFGNALGGAFQITDDILDLISDTETLGKPAGSDIENNKTTFPSIAGVEKSVKIAKDLIVAAKSSISDFKNQEGYFLNALADMVIQRIA